jgi:hypothetical protein
MSNTKVIFLAIIVAGLASCGSGNSGTTDSTSVSTMDTSSVAPLGDTVPAAEIPAGAVNPGEDSARFGTGTNDSSKNRRP